MHSSKNITLLLMIFLSLSFTLLGCGNTQSPERQLDDYIQKIYSESNMTAPALSVLIIDNGKIVYNKSYGYANVETMEKANSNTNYRLASLTKMFTAMSIMILKDQGLLDYDTKVIDILEDFPEYGKDITVRQLLSHTAGLKDYYDLVDLLDEEFDKENQLRDSDVYEIVKRTDSTYFTPGASFRYSDTGYTVLGLVVEKVSGMELSDFMNKNIFVPLEMYNTVAFDKTLNMDIKYRAYGTEKEGSKFIIKDQSYSSAVLGDGGVYSSVEDLYKWDQALYSDVLVSNYTLEEAYTPASPLNSLYNNYNFGWFFRKNGQGELEQSHEGGTQGFSTYYLRVPEQKKTLIVLSNKNNDQQAYTLHKFVRGIYGFDEEYSYGMSI